MYYLSCESEKTGMHKHVYQGLLKSEHTISALENIYITTLNQTGRN